MSTFLLQSTRLHMRLLACMHNARQGINQNSCDEAVFTRAVALLFRDMMADTTKLSQEQLKERRDAALKVVQAEGLPDLIKACRSGTDAEKEKACEKLSFIASHDQQCSETIVSVGGIVPLVAMMQAESGRGDDDITLDMRVSAILPRPRDASVYHSHVQTGTCPPTKSLTPCVAAGSGDQVHLPHLRCQLAKPWPRCRARLDSTAAQAADRAGSSNHGQGSRGLSGLRHVSQRAR